MKIAIWVSLVVVESILLMPSQAFAVGSIYRCEAEAGVTVYQSSSVGQNCRLLNLAPLLPAASATVPPKRNSWQATGSGGFTHSGSGGVKLSPPSFPKVDAATQHIRDQDKRKILEEELLKEQRKKQDLQRELEMLKSKALRDNSGWVADPGLQSLRSLAEDVSRAEGNISSLTRELEMLKGN